MTQKGISEGQLTPVELGIIRSFGWAFVEFEATLFQKYLQTSAEQSLITEKMFRKHLREMEAKGYLLSLDFQGKRAWKRLVVEDEIEASFLSPDDIRATFARSKEKSKKKKERPQIKEHLVTDTRIIGKDLLDLIVSCLMQGRSLGPKEKEEIQEHIENMHDALCDSEEKLLEYVVEEFPSLLPSIDQVLKTRGSEFLLLSLRMITVE